MSRGLGYMQRYLLGVISQAEKPMTFADIFGQAFHKGSYEADMVEALGSSKVAAVRSLRRALRKMCDDGAIVAIGEGGRRDPHRYCFNPMVAAMAGTKEDFEKAVAVMESDKTAS